MKATYKDLASQLPRSNQPVLKNVLYNQCHLQKQKIIIDKQRQHIEESVPKKYDIFDRKARRELLKRTNIGRRGHIIPKSFPSEIFTSYWNKLKSIFGHMRKDPEPDDPISKA